MIHPPDVRVVIASPEGMHFTSWGDGLSREGDHLIYEGHPTGNLDLEATLFPAPGQDLA